LSAYKLEKNTLVYLWEWSSFRDIRKLVFDKGHLIVARRSQVTVFDFSFKNQRMIQYADVWLRPSCPKVVFGQIDTHQLHTLTVMIHLGIIFSKKYKELMGACFMREFLFESIVYFPNKKAAPVTQ
jgi:hypothetical protein